MAEISDMKMKYRIFMKTYEYRSLEWKPGVLLEKPLHEARIGVVTTAAFHTPDQEPFDTNQKGGDPSFRILPENIELNKLKAVHPSESFDHSGIDADSNLALPLDRLRELKKEGFIGSSSPRHLSFMGVIISPEKLINETAEKAADIFIEDQVDGVLLTPV
ncbi:MAG: glycine/sarcosine/betaine reductase selenoprotein B family protein [Acidobacteriota bacterium]